MPTIWMYWENRGRGMPTFVRHCIDSVRLHAGSATVRLLDQQSVQEWVPGLRGEWHALKSPAHKADYIRTRLGHLHGGMWLDCDMVALTDLSPLFELPQGLDFACQTMAGAIGCFFALSGCRLLQRVAEAQDEVLDREPDGFEWNAIGNKLLERLGAEYPHHEWPRWTVDEIAGGRVTKLLSRSERVEDNVDRNARVFHFCGNILTPLLDTYARHQHANILNEQMLASKILRRALRPHRQRAAWPISGAALLDLADGAKRRAARLMGR